DGSGTTGALYEMFLKVDANGNPQVNTSDSNVIYTESNLAWRPAGGLTSVSINAPTVGTTATKFNLTNTANGLGVLPKVYVTAGESLPFGAVVQGPVKDVTAAFSAYKTDNSAAATNVTWSGTGSATFMSSVAQDVIVLAKSNAATDVVSSRFVSAVPVPLVTAVSALPTTVASGATSTLSYTLSGGATGTLTVDTDPTFTRTLAAGSSTTDVNPTATSIYSLTATNLAGKTSTAVTVPVSVSGQSGLLDCTITVPGAATGNKVTAGNTYLVRVPASAGATYTWSVQNASITGGLGTNQLTIVVGAVGSNPVISVRKDLNGAFNLSGNSLTLNGNITNSSSNNQTIGPNMALAQTSIVHTGSNAKTLTLSGNLSDVSVSAGLTVTGSGMLILSGNNTHSGVTTLSGGTLSVGSIGYGGNLGAANNAASNLVFDGGVLQYTGTGTDTSNRAFTINAGKTATINTANNLTLAGATGAATTGALTKDGTGTLTLTGANAYNGNTLVNSGTLALTGTASITSTGSINVGATSVAVVQYDSSASSSFANVILGASYNLATFNQTAG
ncbi:MAG: autotransporter-associated beta strand repeat-containing protein, partial [Verrucomicrobiota bacterium]